MIQTLLASSFLVAAGAAETSITVRLYDLAGAPPEAIERATDEASEIFERAGVGLRWLDCSGSVPASECFAIRGPTVVNLRLMPAQMQPDDLPRGVFGFAVMASKGGLASIANVYLEQVSAISDGCKYRRDVLLGAMMAHELGHLLLGANSHSPRGLMALPWGPKALLAADRGMLSFSKREAARIRAAAIARAAPSPTPRFPRLAMSIAQR